jgi:hypothetical protein
LFDQVEHANFVATEHSNIFNKGYLDICCSGKLNFILEWLNVECLVRCKIDEHPALIPAIIFLVSLRESEAASPLMPGKPKIIDGISAG